MKRAVATLCVLATLPAAAAWAATKCELRRYGELPVTMRGTKPLVAGTMNGMPALFLADSGAFFSTLSRAGAAKYQLTVGGSPVQVRGAGGTTDTGMSRVKDFSLTGLAGGQSFKDVVFLVVSNANWAGDIAGIIGQNVLGHADTEYDLANGVIRLFHAKDCSGQAVVYWGAGASVAEMHIDDLTASTPHIIGSAKINGRQIRVMFDSGAQRSMLTRDAAARVGIKPDSDNVTAAGISSGIGKKTTETWLARFDTLDLGGEEIKNARLRVADIGELMNVDMLLGADFFLSHRIYIAATQHRIYFTYNGGPVFDLRPATFERSVQAAAPGVETAAGTDPANTSPVDAAGLRRRGEASAGRQDFKSALTDFDQAIELDPADAESWYQRGLVRRANREPELAMADINQALTLKPDYSAALMMRGVMRLARQDQIAATADFEAALSASHNDPGLQLAVAQSFESVGNVDESLRRLDAWISANPKDDRLPLALNSRCRARAVANRELTLALADCNASLKNGPRNSVQYDSRALVFMRQGDFDKAITDYKAALKLQPKSPGTLYGLGLAELKRGQSTDGRQNMQAATALNPAIGNVFRRWGLAGDPLQQ